MGLLDDLAHMCVSRGLEGQGSGPPLNNHKSIGFLSIIGTDLLKIHKATKLADRCASETPFKCGFPRIH